MVDKFKFSRLLLNLKFISVIIFLVGAGIGATSLLNIKISEKESTANMQQSLNYANQKIQSELQNWTADNVQFLTDLAHQQVNLSDQLTQLNQSKPDDSVRIDYISELNNLLNNQLNSNTNFIELFILDFDTGHILTSTNPSQIGQDLSDRPYFEFGKTSLYEQTGYWSTTLQSPAYTIASPIQSGANGQIIGVLVGRVNLAVANQILSQTQTVNQATRSYLVNLFKRVIASSDPSLIPQAESTSLDSPPVAKGLEDNSGSLVYEYGGVKWVTHFQVLPDADWILISELPESAIVPASQELTYYERGGTILIFTVISIIATFASNWLLKSFKIKTKQLEVNNQNLEQEKNQLGNQIMVMVRNTLSMIEYRDQLEDRNVDLVEAKHNLEQQNITLVKNAQRLAEYRNQLEAKNIDLEKALTKAQQLSQSLASEKQQTETLLQSLTDGVFAVDQDLKVIMFNKAAEKITFLSKDQIIGHPVDEVLKFYKADKQIILSEYTVLTDEEKEEYKEKGLQMNLNSHKVYISLAVAPVQFAELGKTGWIVTFQDITKERQLEAMKLDFVSMAAHELRTPLTTVQGYISMLQQSPGLAKLNDLEREFVNKAVISAIRLNKLIENLLVVSKIEKQSIALNLEPVDLAKVAQKLVTEMQSTAKQKKLSLILTPLEQPIPVIQADSLRIEEVFGNLISNAINYTDRGEIKISLSVENGFVVSTISDTGKGIPEEAISQLFTKFFRVKGDLVESGSKGTGLGLFISKNIVKAHGGDIWVESELDVGSKFHFKLPIKKS